MSQSIQKDFSTKMKPYTTNTNITTEHKVAQFNPFIKKSKIEEVDFNKEFIDKPSYKVDQDGTKKLYYSNGNIRMIMNPDGSINNYDKDGNLTMVQTQEGVIYSYNNKNIVRIVDPSGVRFELDNNIKTYYYNLKDNSKVVVTVNKDGSCLLRQYSKDGKTLLSEAQTTNLPNDSIFKSTSTDLKNFDYLSDLFSKDLNADLYHYDKNGKVISVEIMKDSKFVKFIQNMEGCRLDDTGLNYVAYTSRNDSCITIGYGVTWEYNIERFNKRGIYSLNDGDILPRKIVDDIKLEIIEETMVDIKNEFLSYGVNLTDNQLYAIVSRSYNSGSGKELAEVYKRYQGKYDKNEIYKNESGMWKDFLMEPILGYDPNAGLNVYLPGLAKRRVMEWILFTTGEYVNLDDINLDDIPVYQGIPWNEYKYD